ncbi:MAG TPA: DUF1572 domain-containing protein [Flavipsychrobacter sp.]
MSSTQQLAKHFRDVHFGGNWTCVNLEDTLDGVTWQQATAKVHDCNTIAVLVFHINYYVVAQIKVLQGGSLDAHDKYSFDCPPILSQADWDNMLSKVLTDAKTLAALVEQLPESKLWEPFVEEKYGTYYRNILGVIEHTHYHLGQISLLKKITSTTNDHSA